MFLSNRHQLHRSWFSVLTWRYKSRNVRVFFWEFKHVSLYVISQVLSRRPWTSGSFWSSCLSSAAASQSRPQVWMGAACPTAQQIVVGRSAQKTWPCCWLGRPGRTAPWLFWRSAECNWSFHLTPNWSVSCCESLRRGRGESEWQLPSYQSLISPLKKEAVPLVTVGLFPGLKSLL